MLQNLQISFRSAPDLPPPHAFQAEIHLTIQDNTLMVKYHLEYIERDLLEKEEIEAEGFTENDDFKWEGTLPEIWKSDWLKLFEKTTLIPEEPHQLYVVADSGSKKSGRPEPEAEWVLQTEQTMQACLEAGGSELPMELVLGKLEKNQFFEKALLVWFFENKTMKGQSEAGKIQEFNLDDWHQSQADLKTWIETEAMKTDLFQLPAQKGWYWLMNGEVWLPFDRTKPVGTVWDWARKEAGF